MKSIVYSIAAAALALTACTKEYENTYILPQEEEVGTCDQIGVTMPEQTRTYLNDKNEVLWEEGDHITAWSDFAMTPIEFALETGKGSTTATFSVGKGQGVKYDATATNTFYAIYPASSSKTITIPQNQNWKGFKNFYKDVNPMIATGTDFNKLKFENPCSILAFQLVTDGQADAYLYDIELSTKSGTLSGTASITSWTSKTLNWTTKNKTVSLTGDLQPISKNVDKPSIYYIVVPAAICKDLEITVTYESDNIRDLTKKRSYSSPITFPAGGIYTFTKPFVLTTKDPEPPTPPTPYKVGDVYPKEGTPVGVVFQAAADGLSGKIVALNDCTAEGTETGSGTRKYYTYTWSKITDVYDIIDYYPVYSQTNGLANMEIVKSALDQFPAFAACAAIKTGGLDWYLPASNELSLMFTNKGDYLAALKANNGTDLNAQGYWSSSIQGSEWALDILYYSQARPIGITATAFEDETKKYAVRAIAQFVSE